ncbi:MAG: hypothetical protein WBX25_25675 [Rhodomicrobium sp.]
MHIHTGKTRCRKWLSKFRSKGDSLETYIIREAINLPFGEPILGARRAYLAGNAAYIADLVPGQMAEFGHILPPSGKEEEWMTSLPSEDRERMTAVGRGRD